MSEREQRNCPPLFNVTVKIIQSLLCHTAQDINTPDLTHHVLWLGFTGNLLSFHRYRYCTWSVVQLCCTVKIKGIIHLRYHVVIFLFVSHSKSFFSVNRNYNSEESLRCVSIQWPYQGPKMTKITLWKHLESDLYDRLCKALITENLPHSLWHESD